MAIEVTDEMRRAVYEADCAAHGHILDTSSAVGNDGDVHPERYTPSVIGPDADTLPHIRCQRCTKIWLVIEDPGDDYADAVAKLKARVRDPESVKPRPRKVQAHQH